MLWLDCWYAEHSDAAAMGKWYVDQGGATEALIIRAAGDRGYGVLYTATEPHVDWHRWDDQLPALFGSVIVQATGYPALTLPQ